MFKPKSFVSFHGPIFRRPPSLKAIYAIHFLLFLAQSFVPLLAAPPANDQCAGAVAIPGNGPFPFYAPLVNIADATISGNEAPLTNMMLGFCTSPVSRGVWYSFTPTTNAFYTLSTCSGGTTVGDTVIAIHTSAGGCNGPFTRVECNDDSCGPGGYQASITRQLLKDTLYFIVIWQYDTELSPGQEELQLVINRESPPANDTCAAATTLFLNTRITGSTSLASNDYQLSGAACFTGVGQAAVTAAGRDVAYSFTAPEAGTFSIKAYNYSFEAGFNLVLYAVNSCLAGTPPILLNNCLAAANRNPATTAEEISCLPLSAGQQIFIIVDDAVGTNRGSSFTLEITRCHWETEPNNFATNASPYFPGVEGAMSPPGDSDFFALGSFPAGSRLFALLDGEAANIPEFDLRVTSLTDTLEYDDKDNDSLFAQSSPNMAGTPLPGGPAFLRVNYNGAALAEPYRLYATVQPPAAVAALEAEPNNTIAMANMDSLNYFHGSLHGPAPSTDVDVFSFFAEEGDLVFVSLDSDPLRDQTPINGQLELLDGFGNSLVLVNDVNSISVTNVQPGNMGATVPNSPAEGLVYRCAEGSYFVRVSISPNASGLSSVGDYLLSISKNCLTGDAGYNTAPIVAPMAVTPSPEGGSATLTTSVFDPDLGDALEVTVSWGDGTTNIIQNALPGLIPILMMHNYADDAPSGTPSDNYQVNVSVSDRLGSGESGATPATVNNLPPALSDVAVTTPVDIGSNAVLTGSISDPGLLDTFYLTVGWGDGSTQHFNYPAGTASFSLPHAYASAGNFTIAITLNDDDTGEAVASTQTVVKAAAEPARFLGMSNGPNGEKLLSLQGTPNAGYRIQWSSNLISWVLLTNAVADATGLISTQDATPSPSSRFYRAVAP